jgi:hypothetical protein
MYLYKCKSICIEKVKFFKTFLTVKGKQLNFDREFYKTQQIIR